MADCCGSVDEGALQLLVHLFYLIANPDVLILLFKKRLITTEYLVLNIIPKMSC